MSSIQPSKDTDPSPIQPPKEVKEGAENLRNEIQEFTARFREIIAYPGRVDNPKFLEDTVKTVLKLAKLSGQAAQTEIGD